VDPSVLVVEEEAVADEQRDCKLRRVGPSVWRNGFGPTATRRHRPLVLRSWSVVGRLEVGGATAGRLRYGDSDRHGGGRCAVDWRHELAVAGWRLGFGGTKELGGNGARKRVGEMRY
jgi:hypothetical protein